MNKWIVPLDFGIMKQVLCVRDTLTLNICCGQIPRTSLKSYWNQQSRWTFRNYCSSQWMVLMLIRMYWNWCPPTKEKRSIRISSALEVAVSTLFMGHFKVVLTRRIGSWQRYFMQYIIFLKSHLLGLTNIWKFVNLILLPYSKSIYFRKHKLADFILFDTSKQIVFFMDSLYNKFLSSLLIVAITWSQKYNF